MKMKTRTQQVKQLLLAFSAATGIATSAHAAIITVNTTNNTDFSAGKTNLWLAIKMANTNGQTANTINFNIPGTGPFYLVTPRLYAPGGVPRPGRRLSHHHQSQFDD